MRSIFKYFFPLALALLLVSCGKAPPAKESRLGNCNDTVRYKIPENDSLGYFSISPEGNRICVLYKKGIKWHVIINDKRYDNFTATFNDSFEQKPKVTVSSGGRRVGLTFMKPKSWQAASELAAKPGPASVSADTSQWYVQIDRHIFGGFDADFAPAIAFSPDGVDFGFVYKKGGSYFVQVGDTTFGPYQRADLAINENGEVFIAYIRDGYASIEKVERVRGN